MSAVSHRQLFLNHVAQTTTTPLGLEVVRAEGIYLYTAQGERFVDLVSGVSVSAVGHCHPKVVEAVQRQAAQYMHLMVYGEYIQAPQVQLATRLAGMLPATLQSVYFVNSGSEANEGALKLAKRYTGRTEIIGCRQAYHGSTQGVLSLMGSEEYKRNYRPLLPDVRLIDFDAESDLCHITHRTACVLVEPIQAEAGVRMPSPGYLRRLRARCTEVGALLIFDEVQTGAGRTGHMFAFEQYGVIPDILTIAKAFGGGMPLGAFVSSPTIMHTLTHNPILGHITTFGGHPVSCAASLAMLDVLQAEQLLAQVEAKSTRFRESMLRHHKVKEVRGVGLLLAVELGDAALLQEFCANALAQGIALDWFLHCNTAFRIAPPLTITHQQIDEVCVILHRCLG